MAGFGGVGHRGTRPARDSLSLRSAAPSNPDKYADELLDAYLFIEDADALYAEYAVKGVEFTRGLGSVDPSNRLTVSKGGTATKLPFVYRTQAGTHAKSSGFMLLLTLNACGAVYLGHQQGQETEGEHFGTWSKLSGTSRESDPDLSIGDSCAKACSEAI